MPNRTIWFGEIAVTLALSRLDEVAARAKRRFPDHQVDVPYGVCLPVYEVRLKVTELAEDSLSTPARFVLRLADSGVTKPHDLRACLQSLWYIELRLILGRVIMILTPATIRLGFARILPTLESRFDAGPRPPHRGSCRCFLRGAVSPEAAASWRMLPADFPDCSHLLQAISGNGA